MIKKIIITGILTASLILSSLGLSQVVNSPSFNTLLRDFDLNEATQNDYAITAVEYEQLQSAWQGLSKAERNQMLYGAAGEFWTNTFVTEIKCDYWQSPIETLVRGIGDCDDFAMAKYVSLRLLGISPEQLLVASVEVASPRIFNHALLFIFPQNETDPWVLDNLTGQIQRLSMRTSGEEIKPIYGLNENQVKIFQEGLYEEIAGIDSPQQFSKFGLALSNSQRLLPPTRSGALAFSY